MASTDSHASRQEAASDQTLRRWKKIWQTAQRFWEWLTTLHRNGNRRFSGRWPDSRFVAFSLCSILLLLVLMLWISPYLGMANDGTVTRTMQNAGLSYQLGDAANANDYFTRTYATRYAASEDHSLQLLLIRFARSLDDFWTQDQLFDVRFLALIYAVLAFPAWGLLLFSIVGRADAFIEKCVLSVLSVLVFADVSYLTYFNSLYPEALYLIGLSYLLGGCMMLQRRTRLAPLYWLALCSGVLTLCSTRQHCSIIGFLAALFCIAQFRLSEQLLERVGVALAAAAVLIAGFCGFLFAESDFDATSQVHAMTRGALLQSSNPEQTLREFGINGSYAILADASLYDAYSLTEEEEYYLQHGFLDQYSTADIALHYLRHPGALFSMLDLGVRSAINLRREYCGNYERSAGMPAQGKSIFFSSYSIFKARSLPQTIAFPLLLVIVCAVLSRSGWWRKKEPDRFYYVYFCTTLLAAAIAAAHLTVVICFSGDAQLTQYNFIAGYSLDCLILFTLAELLHRLNILEEAQEAASL